VCADSKNEDISEKAIQVCEMYYGVTEGLIDFDEFRPHILSSDEEFKI
jgi:hypothetical protein